MKKNKTQNSPPAAAGRDVSPARRAAFEILSKIETDRAFSSVLLPFYEEKLEIRDRALCHELVLGVLRKQLYLDRVIEKLSGGKKLDAAVRLILRLGVYQLLFLDKIPAHAAINDAVNQTAKAKKTSAKGFVNAVLRRLTRERVELEFADELEKLAVETSHPRWLLEKWTADFGFAETARLAAENNRTPAASYRLTARSSPALIESLAQKTIENEKGYLRELAENGKIYFQDEGSQAVGNAVELKDHETFLDVCAAPGSKTTQIAGKIARRAESGGAPNFIAAGDVHASRVGGLRENCRKQGVGFVAIVQYDAERPLPFAAESFDVALVDAPCSGTGTLRHNPEIRYFLAEKDLAELSLKQLKILGHASKVIKRGGRLIYSTCSLEKEENEEVAGRFLAENPDFRKIAPPAGERFLTGDGFARTFPPADNMDGFFIAVFEKI